MAARLDPSTLRCKYHPNCTRKDCYFSHDLDVLPSDICRFFLAGCCFYEDECRFLHTLPYKLNAEENQAVPDEATAREPIVIQPPPASEISPPSVPAAPQPRRSVNVASTSSDDAISSRTRSKSGKNVKKGRRTSPSKKLHVDEHSEGTSNDSGVVEPSHEKNLTKKKPPLCPIGLTKICPLIDCPYRHGVICDMCHSQALDPLDAEQSEAHRQDCMVKLEKDLKAAFEAQESKEVQCQICLDNVLNPKKAEEKDRRFGILEKCEHPFCFSCVMQWRQQPNIDATTKTFRSCPTCRQPSFFVIPSKIWPQAKEQKEKLIAEFKKRMGKRPCRKFNHGKGKCKFGSACWYLHAKEDGTIVTLPPPRIRVPGVVHMEYLMDDDGLDFDINLDVDEDFEDDGDYYSGEADDDEEYLDMLNITHELMEAGIPDEDALQYVFGNDEDS